MSRYCIAVLFTFIWLVGCGPNQPSQPSVVDNESVPEQVAPEAPEAAPEFHAFLHFNVVVKDGLDVGYLEGEGFEFEVVGVYEEDKKYLLKITGVSEGRIRLFVKNTLSKHSNILEISENSEWGVGGGQGGADPMPGHAPEPGIHQIYELTTEALGFVFNDHPDGPVESEFIEAVGNEEEIITKFRLTAPTQAALLDAEEQLRRAFPNATLTRVSE